MVMPKGRGYGEFVLRLLGLVLVLFFLGTCVVLDPSAMKGDSDTTETETSNSSDSNKNNEQSDEQNDESQKSDEGPTEGVVIPDVYEKFVVVAVAGQSNAVGYDEYPADELDVAKDKKRIKQLKRGDTPEIIDLTHCAHNMQDMSVNVYRAGYYTAAIHASRGNKYYTKGVHLPLANLIMEEIPKDYGVLVVPVAYGGTNLERGSSNNTSLMWSSNLEIWGPNTNYSYILQNRIKWALDQNENNKFAGIVWCQGENNANSDNLKNTLVGDNNPATETTGAFEEMVKQINDFLQPYKDRTVKGKIDESLWFIFESTPWFMGTTANRNQMASNSTGNMVSNVSSRVKVIWDFYKSWLTHHGCPNNYVAIPSNTRMNATNYTSSNAGAHFGQNAYREVVAPGVFKAMNEAGVIYKN